MRFDGEPRHEPGRQGRVAMSATGRRPLSRPGRGPRRARPVHDEGRSPAAQLHQDPQGRRARWRPSPGLFEARHRRPLRSGAQGGVRPDREHDRCAHGVDLHPLDPPASPTRRIISAPGAAVDAIPFPVLGMDFDNGSEFTGHGVVRWAGNPGHPLFRPLAPPREERPGHHQDPRSNHAVRRYALLPPRTPTPSTGSRAACGSRPTSSSTHPAPTRKPSGGAPTRPAGASTCGTAPAPPGPAASRRRPDRRTPRRPN